ncbi:MAG: SRPBCC family protein [Acidimicrobiia bacterium]|nr:SRPBCC family protein [Acidimicrobiia bacterium]
MDVVAHLEAPHPAAAVFAVVDDLGTYPRWLDIVPRADPVADGAWLVDLRGRLGPFARSKRLRMARTEREPDRLVVFERAEGDGRQHSPWVLRAEVGPNGDGASRLTMRLHYGGGLWGPVLERLLGDAIEHSRPRLLALLDDR